MREFPRRQRCSLVARSSLVDPDVNRDSGIESFVNWRKRGPPIDCRQPSGVAMSQDLERPFLIQAVPGLTKQKQSLLAKERTIFGVLVGDGESFTISRVTSFGGGKVLQQANHAVQCPSQIDRGGSRLNQ